MDLDPTSGTGTAQKEDPKVAQARLKRIKLRLHDGLHLRESDQIALAPVAASGLSRNCLCDMCTCQLRVVHLSAS